MIDLVKEDKDYQEWLKDKSSFEQIKDLYEWCDYEDYDYILRCKTVEELLDLFAFVNFVVGVEFISEVYEVMNEEIEEGTYLTKNKVELFNKQMGRVILHL